MERPGTDREMINIINADVMDGLAQLPDNSIHCVVTSPPYWGLRDYSVDGQIGLEKTPDEYVAKMVAVFREVRRVLRDDGTVWLNLGDSYGARTDASNGGWNGEHDSLYGGRPGAKGQRRVVNDGDGVRRASGLKPKDLVGIPWRMAFALQADGWWLRSDIIWSKPNPMPESVTDRPTKAHEYIFLLTKSERYYFDQDAVREPCPNNTNHHMKSGRNFEADPREKRRADLIAIGEPPTSRNIRTVWEIATQPYPDAHFATFPEEIAKRCIMAGTSERGCCPKCKAPWERVVERVDQGWDGARYGERAINANGGIISGGSECSTLGSANGKLTGKSKTLGWQPTCACGIAETDRCTVLDPFAGSGTTGAVALELGRKAVLIELNEDYVKLIDRRTQVTYGMAL